MKLSSEKRQIYNYIWQDWAVKKGDERLSSHRFVKSFDQKYNWPIAFNDGCM